MTIQITKQIQLGLHIYFAETFMYGPGSKWHNPEAEKVASVQPHKMKKEN